MLENLDLCAGIADKVPRSIIWRQIAVSDILYATLAIFILICVMCILYIFSGVDISTALAGPTGAVYGPLHGGANEVDLRHS